MQIRFSKLKDCIVYNTKIKRRCYVWNLNLNCGAAMHFEVGNIGIKMSQLIQIH